MIRILPLALAATSSLSPLAPSLQDPPELDFQEGSIAIGRDLATVDLPDGWTFLAPEDARFILEEVWGNPPDPDVLGMIWPATAMEEDGLDASSWAVVVTYDDSGHVDDDDAAGMDYDELLEEMQGDTRAANEARRKAGYGAIDLVGWAEPPRYDPAGKRLYWAQLLDFGGEDGTTLNYNVRVLGREGVLVMNAVADPEELAEVAAGSKELLGRTRFRAGKRYEDFDPSSDRLAAYGIGGLIAGKVLAKAGLFKVLLAFLAKGWKLIAVLVVGGLSILRRFLGGRSAPAGAGRALAGSVAVADDDGAAGGEDAADEDAEG